MGTPQPAESGLSADETQRRQEERLRVALEGADLGTWECIIGTREISWSERCYALFGLEPGTHIDDDTFLAALHPHDRDLVTDAIRATLEQDLEYRVEFRAVWPDGSIHWIASHGRAFRDPSGRPVRMSGVAFEITERKQAEQRLVADLAALKRMQALSTSLTGSFEPLLQDIMDAAVAVVGADRGTLQLMEGESLRIVAHHGHRQPFLEFFAAAAKRASASKEVIRCRERIVVEDVDSSPIFAGTPSLEVLHEGGVLAIAATPLLSRSGKLLGVITTQWGRPYSPDEHDLWRIDLLARQAADLIECARSESEMRRLVQRLDAHMDNSPMAVIEFDPQFRVTRWSSEAERMFGWKAEEIVGRAIEEVRWVYEDDVDLVRRISQGMLDGRLPRNLSTNRNYRKDGSVIQCEWYNSAIYGSDGKLESILSQVLDVTERKQAEERLRQSQKLESLGLLAGGVAHDFNNLLVGVIGNASLAQEMLPAEHPATELVRRVIKIGEQAAHLTRQMLAYSGKGQFLLEVLDLSELVSEIGDLVRPSISKKVTLQFELAKGIPAIRADRGQVQQVLMNLVINAAEAIGGREGQVTVRTGLQMVDERYRRMHADAMELKEGEYVGLEVRDTGCGMDDRVRARIFDPFFSTKFTGRGLGLAAVAGIVRGHKGAIIVSSEPGSGSSFQVLFPPAARRAERRARMTSSAGADRAGLVLVVDDERVVLEVVKQALEVHGHTVLTAPDGAGAIDVLKRHPGKIGLVVLDLSMPGMSGEETLQELRKIRPDVKVLVSSGYSEAEAMTIFQGQRVSGFIQKPYTSRAIAEKVKQALA